MYTMEHRVRYSETDVNKKVKLTEILNYFQDLTIFHSESLGAGLEVLEEVHRAWLLMGWHIEIERYPVFGEEIFIDTWPYDFKTCLGLRNFTIRDKEGNKIVKADTTWLFTDTLRGMPAKPSKDDMAVYQLEPKEESMTYLNRKIAEPDQYEVMDAITITKNMLDTNLHVNNEKYAEMGLEYVPDDFVVTDFRADYRKETKLSEVLIPRVSKEEDKYTIVFYDDKDVLHAIVEFGK